MTTHTLTKEELCKMISISPNCRWCRNPLIMKTTKRESHRFKTEVIDRIWLECTNEGCMRKGGAECILHLNDRISDMASRKYREGQTDLMQHIQEHGWMEWHDIEVICKRFKIEIMHDATKREGFRYINCAKCHSFLHSTKQHSKAKTKVR